MKKAFTLIEIMICIAIVALLAAIAMPAAKKAQCRTDRESGKPMSNECTALLVLDRVVPEKSTQPQTCPACVCSCGNDGLIKAGEL